MNTGPFKCSFSLLFNKQKLNTQTLCAFIRDHARNRMHVMTSFWHCGTGGVQIEHFCLVCVLLCLYFCTSSASECNTEKQIRDLLLRGKKRHSSPKLHSRWKPSSAALQGIYDASPSLKAAAAASVFVLLYQ